MAYLFGGGALVLLGVFLPREWYDALPPSKEQLPPLPVKGVTLLQIVFVIEGLTLICFSMRPWRFVRLQSDERLPETVSSEAWQDIGPRASLWLLAGVTAFAFILRCIHLGADLWLDEITPIFDYRDMPVLYIVTSYISSNNHLLSTLLMKLVLIIFGEKEWALRLPAMLFGTATIPAIYWVSRLALCRRVSLSVALLMAVSYHHIFFSQNARGYTAYLFFSILSSGLLLKGIRQDRMRDWVLYILTMFLNFASLLDSIFVFAAHVVVGTVVIVTLRLNGRSPLPLARRLAAVFIITGTLVLNLYVTMAPQFYVYSKTVYRDPAAGFTPFSAEFLRELTRGLSAGLGAGLLFVLIPFLLVSAAGFLALLKRQLALTLSLTLPGVLTAIFLIAQRLGFSPRFFLLWLPLAMLMAVYGIYRVITLFTDKLSPTARQFGPHAATVIVLIGVAVSLFSLRGYYLVPKQSYRSSLQYLVARRQPTQPVIAISLAEHGYRFYGKRFGLNENADWFPVRSVQSLDSILSKNPGQPSIIVTTFARALRISGPDLFNRIVEGWTLERTFPATIGDGEISVWKQRAEVAQLAP